jgi:tRNA (cmo5U34)-methyltransferase
VNLKRVKTHFEEEAATYNQHILQFIPHYLEQNELLIELVPFVPEAFIRVLDLGAGPGVLSGLMLERFSKAQVHVFDLAENMLANARTLLSEFSDRVTYQAGDFGTVDFGEGYDVILAGLAIHHLDNPGKQALFQRLFAAMNPGGCLLIRDIVHGESEKITAVYERMWCDYIRSMQTDERAVLERYHAEDVPAPMEDQLRWLRESGFANVGCHWKYLNFAIFGGEKPGASA